MREAQKEQVCAAQVGAQLSPAVLEGQGRRCQAAGETLCAQLLFLWLTPAVCAQQPQVRTQQEGAETGVGDRTRENGFKVRKGRFRLGVRRGDMALAEHRKGDGQWEMLKKGCRMTCLKPSLAPSSPAVQGAKPVAIHLPDSSLFSDFTFYDCNGKHTDHAGDGEFSFGEQIPLGSLGQTLLSDIAGVHNATTTQGKTFFSTPFIEVINPFQRHQWKHRKELAAGRLLHLPAVQMSVLRDGSTTLSKATSAMCRSRICSPKGKDRGERVWLWTLII